MPSFPEPVSAGLLLNRIRRGGPAEAGCQSCPKAFLGTARNHIDRIPAGFNSREYGTRIGECRMIIGTPGAVCHGSASRALDLPLTADTAVAHDHAILSQTRRRCATALGAGE